MGAKGLIWLWLPTYRSANSEGHGGSNADSINRLPFDDEAIEHLMSSWLRITSPLC